MKILHVLDHSVPLHSGYSFRTLSILQQLSAQCFETVHLTSAKHESENLQETVDGFLFYRTPKLPPWQASMPIVNQIAVIQSLKKRLREIVRRVRPDILHVHSPALNGIAALNIGLPMVYECRAFWEDAAIDLGTHSQHSLRYLASRALETYVFQKADALTTLCQGLKDDIVKRGIAAEKITLIPNGVDSHRFKFQEIRDSGLRDTLGLKDKLVLGFIGSFYAYEGLQNLLAALPRIWNIYPQTHLLLVGSGPYDAHLKEMSEKLGDRITFIDKADHKSIALYYGQIDIMVYPRLAMRLTDLVTPLKPLEAMALGTLVIASDVGGHKELLNHCTAARFFKAGDEIDLAQKVIDLCSDFELWPRIREEARRFVETERSWQKTTAAYPSVYEQALRNFNVRKR